MELHIYLHVKQSYGDDDNYLKAERAEILLKRKVNKLLTFEDGSTLKIPEFKELGHGSFAFTLRGLCIYLTLI